MTIRIKYSFANAGRDAKIKDLRFHDLRHPAATWMGDAGADAFTLVARMVHIGAILDKELAKFPVPVKGRAAKSKVVSKRFQ